MKGKNYYEILGVSVKASTEEITAAKNALAKRFHPDANLKNGIDTTRQMQEILEAYHVLSDPERRAEYDRSRAGRRASVQTFDLREEDASAESDGGFVVYWKCANDLYDILCESDQIFREHNRSPQLTRLSMQALRHVLTLREAQIPEHYWHPDIMNWLLFTWYKNRNITISYLLTLYDEYVKNSVSAMDRLKLRKKNYLFRHSLRRLIKY